MGLGGAPHEWDDYEWFALADVPSRTVLTAVGDEPLATALLRWLDEHPLWTPRAGRRVLLVDLDNLRADPRRWRARMAVMVALARQADDVALAGQVGAVRRARPHLAELAEQARSVADGSDLADHVLLEAAGRIPAGPAQIVVVSNDGIFATLADRGRLTVVSPGADALSDRLGTAATRLVDLAALEEALRDGGSTPVVPAPRAESVRSAGRARKAAPTKAPAKQPAATNRAAKKAPVKKAPATKAATTKAPATKAAAKKSTATKTAAKRATVTKSATSKAAAAKKAPAAKKAAAKKSTAKKTTAKKTPAAKKSTAKKTPAAKKTTAKKSAAPRATPTTGAPPAKAASARPRKASARSAAT